MHADVARFAAPGQPDGVDQYFKDIVNDAYIVPSWVLETRERAPEAKRMYVEAEMHRCDVEGLD